MNETAKRPVEIPAQSDKSSGAWIRAQFQETDDEDGPSGPKPEPKMSKQADGDADTPLQELDGSLQQLAASLLRVGEAPLQALEDSWSKQLSAVETSLTKQSETLQATANQIVRVETELKKGISEQDKQQQQTVGDVQELKRHLDALEADLSRRLNDISSSMEQLQSEVAAQRATLAEMRQEDTRRSEVAENVSQVLDSLKTSVHLLGGSSEPKSD